MGFSGQECWSGLAFPPPEDLPAPGMEAGSPGSPALALTGGVFTTEPPGKPQAQTLLTGDMFTYITNRWPQALVSAKKKKNPLVNHVITWTLHSWKQGDFSWNTHQEARTGNEGVGAGITALTWCSFAGLKVTGGSRPSGLHASFRSTKTKETGLLYGSICVIELFFASVSKPESRGHKVEWRTMEDVF